MASPSCECPKCGADISETYQGAEPDVGIMSSGWYCDVCNIYVDDDDDGSSFMDEDL